MTERMKKILIPSLISAVVLIAVITVIIALVFQGDEKYRFIKVDGYYGGVSVSRETENMSAFEGLMLLSEDKVQVDGDSLLLLAADDDKKIVAEENTSVELYTDGNKENGKIAIDLSCGKIHVSIEDKLTEESVFQVTTPNASMSVRGTVFTVEYYPEEVKTILYVERGKVLAEWEGGSGLYEEDEGVTIYDRGEKTEELTDENRTVLTFEDEKEETTVPTETALPETTTTSSDTEKSGDTPETDVTVATTVPALTTVPDGTVSSETTVPAVTTTVPETTTSATTTEKVTPEVTTSYTVGGGGSSSDEHSGEHIGTNPSDDELSSLFEVVDTTPADTTAPAETTPAETTTKANGGGLFTTDESGADRDDVKGDDEPLDEDVPVDDAKIDGQDPGNGTDIGDTVTG